MPDDVQAAREALKRGLQSLALGKPWRYLLARIDAYASARVLAALLEVEQLAGEPIHFFVMHDHSEEAGCEDACPNARASRFRAAILRGEL